MTPTPPTPASRTRKLSEIQEKPVTWLWPVWVPQGKVTVLDGDPGLGKSTLLLDLAARVSLSGTMPDGSAGEQGAVVIMSAEDAADDTIKPRLQAAGANEDRCRVLSEVLTPSGGRPPEIPGDLDYIEAALVECGAKLLIVDPLMAYLVGVDANSDQSVRKALYRLSKVAERTGAAVVCMRHLNKGSSAKAIYRGSSSIAIIGHARTGLLVAQDPEDDDARVLCVQKTNLARMPRALRFTLLPTPAGVCRIHWLGECDYKADQLVAQPPSTEKREEMEEAKTKVQRARDLLEGLLTDGKVEIKLARQEAIAAGVSFRNLERAVHQFGLTVTYEMANGKRTYYWHYSATPPAPESAGEVAEWT